MANLVISGDTSGSVTLSAPAVSGTTVLTLPTTSGTIVTTAGATALTTSGNLTFTGTGNRILGDFSNSTVASRVAIQSSITNGNTVIPILTNGTATNAGFNIYGTSDTLNANFLQILASGVINAGAIGTGTFQPITMFTGGSERLRITTGGDVGIGTSSPSAPLTFAAAAGTAGIANKIRTFDNGTSVYGIGISNGQQNYIVASDGNHCFYNVTTERMRIDSSGNLCVGVTSGASRANIRGVGATSATSALDVSNSAAAQLFVVRNDGAIFTGAAAASPFNLTIATAANAVLNGDGFLYRSTSSARYKREIQTATWGLSDINKLRPVTYKGKSKADEETVYGGLIAEEVDQAGLKEFVAYDDQGRPDALHYGNMVSLCIKAIQELNAKVTALETQLGAK